MGKVAYEKGIDIPSVSGGYQGKKRLTNEGIIFREKLFHKLELNETDKIKVRRLSPHKKTISYHLGTFDTLEEAHRAAYLHMCPSYKRYSSDAKISKFAFHKIPQNSLYSIEEDEEMTVLYRGEPNPFSDEKAVDYKFNEDILIEEFQEYVDSTYGQHYAKDKFQATEFIIDGGHGMGFCIGNVLKYAQRYGKKGSREDARKDLMKVLHYALIGLYVHDTSECSEYSFQDLFEQDDN